MEADPAAGGAGLDAAFVALYELHYPRLVRALRLSGLAPPDAEDVAQEAFARTLAHFWRVRRGTNPPGYVFRVAFRLSRAAQKDPARGGLETAVAPARDTGAEATTRVAVEAALAAMPPGRRRCAVACLFAGLSPTEAAVAFRLAPGTVRKQLAAARADFAAALDAGTGPAPCAPGAPRPAPADPPG